MQTLWKRRKKSPSSKISAYHECRRGRTLNPNLVCLILKAAFNGTWAKSPCKTLLVLSRNFLRFSPNSCAKTESVLLIANNRNERNDSLLKTVPYCNSIKYRLTTILHSPPVLRISTVQHSLLTQGNAENFHLISPDKTLQIRKIPLTINKYEKQFDGFKATSSYINKNILIFSCTRQMLTWSHVAWGQIRTFRVIDETKSDCFFKNYPQ